MDTINYHSTLIKKAKRKVETRYIVSHYKSQVRLDLTRFVASVYYDSKNFQFDCDYSSILEQMLEEDLELASLSDTLCIQTLKQELCCTLKLISKQNGITLPFEKVFGYEYLPLTINGGQTYEIARLASDQRNSFLLIIYLICGLCSLVDLDHSVLVAGLDQTVYEKMFRLGFPIRRLGEAKYYLGSYTVPVMVETTLLSKMLCDVQLDLDNNEALVQNVARNA